MFKMKENTLKGYNYCYCYLNTFNILFQGNYLSKKMTIDIGDAQKVLNHELCGAYLIRNKVLDKDTDDVLACYDLSIRVIEVES